MHLCYKSSAFVWLGAWVCMFYACDNQPPGSEQSVYSATIEELSDTNYPDNPDKSIRHALDGTFSHDEIRFIQEDSVGTFSFVISPANDKSTAITLKNINLLEWIPAIPEHIKSDPYLAYIGVINQEWNRVQVSFAPHYFETVSETLEGDTLSRIDLARNCLQAYLWEVIAFAREDGEEKPVYHGWFNFPPELYAALFQKRNNIPYETYREPLENWITPEHKVVNFDVLRTVVPGSEKRATFQNLNAEMYPVQGERKKKKVNIVSPLHPQSMQDFLRDDTQFATFSAPGIYRKDNPRSTQLSRLSHLDHVQVRKTVAKNIRQDTCLELEFHFSRHIDQEQTKLVIGGLDISQFRALSASDANMGSAFSMGISNHAFNQSYKTLIENPALENAYFAMLTDAHDKWLDSHEIGIDGPLFHIDATDPAKLHVWLLSFERHAFVGHYVIEL